MISVNMAALTDDERAAAQFLCDQANSANQTADAAEGRDYTPLSLDEYVQTQFQTIVDHWVEYSNRAQVEALRILGDLYLKAGTDKQGQVRQILQAD
jgi:hypothetical protein